eukprot:12373417-Ditylum_brightwellii.AAC.1
MSKMFADIKEVHVYIDDLLLITNRDWDSHLEQLDEALDKLKSARLKKKMEAILKIAPPKTRKKLCSFIGMINYYPDMWHRSSKVLALLALLTSKATP